MATENEPGRDYLAEAREIANGTTMRLPQKEHLIALDRQLAAMNRNIVTLGEILLAVLLDNGVPSMSVPKKAFERVRSQRTIPIIQAQDDGSVVVRTAPTGPPLPPVPGRRM